MNSISQVNLIKNGRFDWVCYGSFRQGNKNPDDWIISQIVNGQEGGPHICAYNSDTFSPHPHLPIEIASKYVVLQPYNDRRLCFVKQQLSLKSNSKYTLTFHATSRELAFTEGVLVIMINSTIIFTETLRRNWAKYTVEFTSPSSNPILSFINCEIQPVGGIRRRPSAYTVSIADIQLKEKEFSSVTFTYEGVDYYVDKKQKMETEDDTEWYPIKECSSHSIVGRSSGKLMELYEDSDEEEEEEEEEKETTPFATMKGSIPIYGERVTSENVKRNDILIYNVKGNMTFSVVLSSTPTIIYVCDLRCVYDYKIKGAYFYKIAECDSVTKCSLNFRRKIFKLTNVAIV